MALFETVSNAFKTVSKTLEKHEMALRMLVAVGIIIGIIVYLIRRGSLKLPAAIQSMLGDGPFARPTKRTIIDPADRFVTPDATSGPVEIPGRAAYTQRRTSDPA